MECGDTGCEKYSSEFIVLAKKIRFFQRQYVGTVVYQTKLAQIQCHQSEFNHSLAESGPVFLQDGSINMVDIRVLFGAAGKGGYFKDHTWPLWPASDREDLAKFLNFKQIMPISFRLQIINSVSAILWIVYLTLILGLGFNHVRSMRMKT